MFFDDSKKMDSVEIKDSTPTAFSNMLRFIYLREFEDKSTTALCGLMDLADRYKLDVMAEKIKKKFNSIAITLDSIPDLVYFVRRYGDSELSNKCALFLRCARFEDLKFTRALWEHSLQCRIDFGLTPESLFNALKTWSLKSETKKLDRDLLLHFPLTSMDCQDLVTHVLGSDYITNEEFIEILNAKGNKPGGPWARFLKPVKSINISEIMLQASDFGRPTEMSMIPQTDLVLKYVQCSWISSTVYKGGYARPCTCSLKNKVSVFNSNLETPLKLEKFGEESYRTTEPLYFQANQVCFFSTLAPSKFDPVSPEKVHQEIDQCCKSLEFRSGRKTCCNYIIDQVCFVKLNK